MKGLQLLIWLTQLGLSTALPLGGFVLLAVWLRQRLDLGVWVIIVGVVIGMLCAIDSLRSSLKAMEQMSQNRKNIDPPPLSFNDHE